MCTMKISRSAPEKYVKLNPRFSIVYYLLPKDLAHKYIEQLMRCSPVSTHYAWRKCPSKYLRYTMTPNLAHFGSCYEGKPS